MRMQQFVRTMMIQSKLHYLIGDEWNFAKYDPDVDPALSNDKVVTCRACSLRVCTSDSVDEDEVFWLEHKAFCSSLQ